MTIHILKNGILRTLVLQEPLLLAEVIRRAGFHLALPCGGNHTCGKCAVSVCGGFSPMEEPECRLLALNAAELPADCLASGTAPHATHSAVDGLPAGATRLDPHLDTSSTASGTAPHTTHSAADGLPAGATRHRRLACFAVVTGDAQITLDARFEETEILTVGTAPNGEHWERDDLPEHSYGFAVDLGTTTVVSHLYELRTRKLLHSACGMNAQAPFGADVIARIEASNRETPQTLQRPILAQLEELFTQSLQHAGVTRGEVTRAVITGNTTMLHFLTGKDPRGIAVSPFTPQSLFGYELPLATLFPGFAEAASLYLPPCVSAYVGADIVCAMLAADLTGHEGGALLVDIGTNGEMALFASGKLMCCATAAGPAFEGAGLSMGMTAATGAVTRVDLQDGVPHCTTIGGGAPVGLCGTGALSALCLMVQTGVVDETGRIQSEGHPFAELVREHNGQPAFWLGNSGVRVTQQDVRALQLAKAAVAAGIDTLLDETGGTAESISALLICGGFGSCLDPREAVGIGLLPPALLDKTQALGNAAGTGAVALLHSLPLRGRAATLAASAVEAQLSANHGFMERYVEQMLFL